MFVLGRCHTGSVIINLDVVVSIQANEDDKYVTFYVDPDGGPMLYTETAYNVHRLMDDIETGLISESPLVDVSYLCITK